MSFVININGEIFPAEEARLSVLDRGFLYGDSVYEVIRTYKGRPFALERHLERLTQSAERLAFILPPMEQLRNELQRTIERGSNEESYCRLVVTRGCGPIDLDPATAAAPNLIIYVKALELPGESLYEKGVTVIIPGVRRMAPRAAHPAIKSGNYLNSVLAVGAARRQGAFDALMIDSSGNVTEGTASNLFIYSGGTLKTPPLEAGLLAGVTRRLILELAHQNGLDTVEVVISAEDVYGAQEVMLSSTLREVLPVISVDGRTIGSGLCGPVAKKLRRIVRDYALSTLPD